MSPRPILDERFSELTELNFAQKIPAGKTVILENLAHERTLLVQGKPISKISAEKGFFIVGLYSETPYIIRDKVKLEISPRGYWTANMPVHFAQVDLPAGTYKPLNIPEKIWEKVSEGVEERKQKDRERLVAVLSMPPGPLVAQCWQAPLRSKVVSLFASPRTLPNGHNYYHSGVDLRGAVGTKVRAVSSGLVILAEHMIVPGNNIILSHGDGLYSRYMHLNSFAVREGETVTRGQVIGEVGATGRVEAPHLHWEVIWKGNHADPFAFLEQWKTVCEG